MDAVFSAERTRRIFTEIRALGKKGELAEALAVELGRLSVFDLQRISASLEREVHRLPSPYRERIRPYFTEQFFGNYFRLLRMRGDGTLKKIRGHISDKKRFDDYCAMVLSEGNGQREGPEYGGYYYLVACFTMFVLDEPGHPVGMPFPGGFTVERRGDAYYCPIRDREKDVPFSICNFCPATQGEI